MPDKKLRLQIYKFMRTCLINLYWFRLTNFNGPNYYLVKDFGYCFCLCLQSFLRNKQLPLDYFTIIDLPELMEHEPIEYYRKNEGFWFNRDQQGIRKRINVLDTIIAELEKELI